MVDNVGKELGVFYRARHACIEAFLNFSLYVIVAFEIEYKRFRSSVYPYFMIIITTATITITITTIIITITEN